MAISFITTVGAADANSYVTVAEFNTYVEKLLNSDNLPKSSQTTLIKKLLLAATEVIDAETFDGYRTDISVQNLEFPRIGLVDRAGYSIDENTIPQELKDAVCEMAIFLYENQLNHAQHSSWDDEVQSASIGGSVTINYKSGVSAKPNTLLPERVKFLLERIGQRGWIPHLTRVCRL